VLVIVAPTLVLFSLFMLVGVIMFMVMTVAASSCVAIWSIRVIAVFHLDRYISDLEFLFADFRDFFEYILAI